MKRRLSRTYSVLFGLVVTVSTAMMATLVLLFDWIGELPKAIAWQANIRNPTRLERTLALLSSLMLTTSISTLPTVFLTPVRLSCRGPNIATAYKALNNGGINRFNIRRGMRVTPHRTFTYGGAGVGFG